MNSTLSSIHQSRVDITHALGAAAKQLERIGEQVSADVPGVYARIMGEDFYTGGWANSPELPAEAFLAFNSWLSSGGPAPSSAHICTIGANRLWNLIDVLCQKVSNDIVNSLQISRTPGDPWWSFVSGGTLTFSLRDETVWVYGGKNRGNLKGEQTYDDKYITITADGAQYRLRAVDSRDTDVVIEAFDRNETKAAAVVGALQLIHRALVSGTVSFEPELFDKGLTSTALKELLARLDSAFGPK